MKKLIIGLFLLFIPFVIYGQEVVERIDIVGNERVTPETIKYYLTFREGDYYSPDLIRRDFKVLWATGFFSDIKIEENDGQFGKVIVITVQENPVIRDIVYKTGKKVKEDDIIERLKEKDAFLLPYSYYSEHKVQRIESTIKELLAEKGLPAGKIETQVTRQGQNELEIVFDIDEGPKIRVGEIVFEGDPKLPDSTLISAIKENKKHGIVSWITGKDAFKESDIAEDLLSIKTKLQEYGYMEASIGEPRFEDMEKRSIFMSKQPMKRIIIPVNAGYRYTVGEVAIEGLKFFNARYVRSLIKMKEGDIYSTEVREKAVEDIGEAYRDYGYLFIQVRPIEKLDPKNKRVNVTYSIFEGEIAYLNRLEFKGNVFTKDKVIRREMILREGDRFSLAMFRDSLLRLNQLGLVEMEGEPNIQPSPDDPTQLDVTVNVTEMQRNNIQFTAGYSGYQGTFLSLSYSTVNFLGAGERLELSLSYGSRYKNYSFGFTEPYFLDLPISLGFNIHDMRMVYPGLYNQRSRGIDLSTGSRLFGYWRGSLVYSYNNMDLSAYEGDDDDYYPYYPGYGSYPGYGGIGGTGYINPYYSYGNYHISSITPSVYRTTIDSPLTPTRGTLISASAKVAGGVLGGDVDMIKPRFEFTKYIPVFKRQSFGFHVEYSFIHSLADFDEVPYWERFYLGGERSIRGYEIYTIGPRNEDGYNLGGVKSLVFNAEYIIPVGGPLYAILFMDAGNALTRYQKWDFNNLYSSTGLELRIFVPALRVPFRLIFSYNNRTIYRGDSNYTFRFAIGTTF
jgi:outer membrane protein insertion porin family